MGGGLTRHVDREGELRPESNISQKVDMIEPELDIATEETTADIPVNSRAARRRLSVGMAKKTSIETEDNFLLYFAKQSFASLDKDKTGFLHIDDLRIVMEQLLEMYAPVGKLLTETEKVSAIQKSVDLVQLNHDSKLDLFQFVSLFEEVCTRVSLMGQASSKFSSLDIDASGYLEKEELLAVADWVLESYEKVGFTENERQQIKQKVIDKIDSNSDGCLDLYEFSLLFEHATTKIRMMNNARSMFNELDVRKTGHLERSEVEILAGKLLTLYNFHNDGSQVTLSDKAKMADRIMQMFDVNHQGKIDLYTFSHIYENVTEQMAMCSRAREKFIELDTDKDSMLSADEIRSLMDWVLSSFLEVSTADYSNESIALNLQNAINKNLSLDFKIFITLFSDVTNRVHTMQKAKARFNELDTNKSGYLEADEIKDTIDWMLLFYTKKGESLSPEEKDAMKIDMMSLVDTDEDGRLNLVEFITIFNQVESRKEEVRRRASLFMF